MFPRKNFASSGFSLAEILIALTILGLTLTFVAGKLMTSLNRGKVDTAKINIQGLVDRLEEYHRDCNAFPTTEQGLQALVEKPVGGKDCQDYQVGGYAKDIPQDPWKNDFVYTCEDGKNFVLMSYGKDGQEGGEGFDADIQSNKL